jgi:hypothetical protein
MVDCTYLGIESGLVFEVHLWPSIVFEVDLPISILA